MTATAFKIRNGMQLKNAATDTYYSTFANTTLTAARTYTFANADMTVAATNYAQTFSGLQSFSAGLSITGGTTNNYLAIQTGGTAASTRLTLSGTIWQFGLDTTIKSSIDETGAAVFSVSVTSATIYGSTSSGGSLTLSSTSHATKGPIYFGVGGDKGNISSAGIWTMGPSTGKVTHTFFGGAGNTTGGLNVSAAAALDDTKSNVINATNSTGTAIATIGITNRNSAECAYLRLTRTDGGANCYLWFHTDGKLYASSTITNIGTATGVVVASGV